MVLECHLTSERLIEERWSRMKMSVPCTDSIWPLNIALNNLCLLTRAHVIVGSLESMVVL